ncbi:hypothetical protein CRENBAI_000764 [Crenichthys baileyi]|uniref:Immunoglobulin domain-containing protein n=1 Tax=Crenichthys baileyi TaxID=28760 RepID=A0AAV9RSX1_9TELE
MWSCQHVLVIICTLSGVSGAAGLIHVFGYEGKKVKISCPYIKGYESNGKYLCKNGCGYSDVLITTLQRNTSKYFIYDDTKKTILTVTISDLRSHDAGKYWCGVSRLGKDLYTEVKLEVKKELELFNISGIVGHPVTLQCPNPPEQRDKKKFLCKGDQHNNCTDIMENQRKFMLHNVSSSCFSVTITDLEAADAGTYYCGSDSQLSYIKIQLAVVSADQTSTVTPIITDEQITSLTTSPHLTGNFINYVTLFYILPAVLTLLLILVFLLWMVLKYKSRSKKVDGVGLNVLNSDVGMISNDVSKQDLNSKIFPVACEENLNFVRFFCCFCFFQIYELQENVVYMNTSSPPNMSNHDDIYNNILYRRDLLQLGNVNSACNILFNS